MKNLIMTAAILTFSAGMTLAQTVRLGTEGAYPPYNFINDKGEVDGFERALGDELCKRAGLTCTWVTNDWDSIIPNLQSGNYDAIIAGMSITDERKEVIEFTQNYVPPAPSSYAAGAVGQNVGAGATVAAQTGTIQAGYVAASGATLIEFATPDESVAAVRNGQADAVFADKDFLVPIVSESGGALVMLDKDVSIGGGIGLGLRKSDTDLKAKFDKVITEMKGDGSLNALIKKWFGDDASTF